MTELPPFLPFLVGAMLAALTRGRLRAIVSILVPAVGGIHVYGLPDGIHWQTQLMGFEVKPFEVDTLSRLFGLLFHLAAFIAFLFALHVRRTAEHVAAMLYAAGALGAVFAGDLLSLFVFWELMAVSSAILVCLGPVGHAVTTGIRYLIIQVISGVLLLAGALSWYRQTGSLDFTYMGLDSLAGVLVLLAFGIKAAFPLMHNWLTDAYPAATPTGAVFMSSFTTKTAVYCLARGFPGTELLVYVGVTMTCFPIFYAVIENDLRRVLTYSMINQIGFMVTGIGIGTALAVNGAVAHAFNDVLFKGLLFMAMGAVLHVTGRINGSDLGGLYKTMPVTTVLCVVGAASISAFPLFSGFVSKSMVMTAVLEEGHVWAWLALLFASAGVFHHAGIKIPFFAFFAHDAGIRAKEPPINMLAAMSIAAALCVAIGCYPELLYRMLPFDVDYWPYDGTHVLAQLQLLFFSAAAFIWLKLSGLYPPELPSVNVDAEWVYRRWLPRLWQGAAETVVAIDRSFRRRALVLASEGVRWLHRHHGPQGILARAWPTGSMVMWVAALLGLYLLLYYM